ncbi:Tripartite motif-containing protein 65 [Microbotryomycetes sp. JL221]|nr:Tripartite motif-containing protein 65 [Microbotryomycetes sp. JL221]
MAAFGQAAANAQQQSASTNPFLSIQRTGAVESSGSFPLAASTSQVAQHVTGHPGPPLVQGSNDVDARDHSSMLGNRLDQRSTFDQTSRRGNMNDMVEQTSTRHFVQTQRTGADSFMSQMMPQNTGFGIPHGFMTNQQHESPSSAHMSQQRVGQSTRVSTPPQLPRRPAANVYGVTTDDATSNQLRPTLLTSPFSLRRQTSNAMNDTNSESAAHVWSSSIQETIKSASQAIMASYEQSLKSFTNVLTDQARANNRSSDGTNQRNATQFQNPDVDQLTQDFVMAFPSLSRPSSPTDQDIHISTVTKEKQAFQQAQSSFSCQLSQIADMLSVQIMRQAREEVEAGSKTWQVEKQKGIQEMAEVEEEMDQLKQQVASLENRLNAQSTAHDQDLQAAARNAAELSERVEVLQAALNQQQGSIANASSSRQADSADAWTEIINEQASAITKYEQALTAVAGPVTCTVCTGVLNNPTTLPCGHSGCLECFQGWLRLNQTCPTCREPCHVGEGFLRTNVALDAMVQALKAVGVEDR